MRLSSAAAGACCLTLAVDLRSGEISAPAVIPGSTVTYTGEHKTYVDAMLGDVTPPDCVVEASYTPEPIATDVEVGETAGSTSPRCSGRSARPLRSARSTG